MSTSTPVEKKYMRRTIAFMGIYVALNVAAIFGAVDSLRGPAAWLFALAVAAPVVAQVWAFLILMRDSDEYISSIMARRFIVASGAAMAIYCSWGFLETYARAPHLPAMLILAVFWGLFGLVTPFIQATR